MPEVKCLSRERCRTRVVSRGGRLTCLLHERLEDLRVENGRTEIDPVSASASLEDDAVRRKRLAKPGDVCLEAVCRGRRRTVPPDLVDQAPIRYDLPRTQ